MVFNNDTFWLTHKAMAQLFVVEVLAISKHLKNIFESKGKVTMLEAKLKAVTAFSKYRIIQDKDYESDFDKMMEGLK